MQALFHVVDKNYIDPVNYITEAKTSELCQKITSLNHPDPSNKKFELDQEWQEIIHQILERQQKILHVVEESSCQQDSHMPIEQILRSAHPGLYSPNTLAIIHGYLHTKIKISEEIAIKLKMAQESEITSNPFAYESKSVSQSGAAKDLSSSHLHAHDLSPSALEQLILQSNPSWTMKFANLIRKAITNPIGYLTDSKAATISEAVLFFHPSHPEFKEFNRSIPLHKALVHQAFEREIRLYTHFETSLKCNNHDAIVTLHQKVSPGYFSNILKTLMGAYLKYIADKKTIDAVVRQKNALGSLNAQKAPEHDKDKTPGTPLSAPIPPSAKNPPLNLEGNCNCNPPHQLKACAECLSKLGTQPPQ